MNKYIISWGDWLLALGLLIGFYFVLMILLGILRRVHFLGQFQKRVVHFLDVLLKLYEPIVATILLIMFVFINPYIHGLFAAFLLLVCYFPVKNYMNGRVFLWSNELEKGNRIQVEQSTGVIQDLGRLGLSLQTKGGLRFINYSNLLQDGYMLLKGDRVGCLHQIEIHVPDDHKTTKKDFLQKRLFACPYIDWTWKPRIISSHESEKNFIVQLMIREDQHLQYLVDLIREWGYECSAADAHLKIN